MVQDIRKNRCRSLSEDEVITLLDDINQEMMGGRNMFNYLIDETVNHTKGPQQQRDEDLR